MTPNVPKLLENLDSLENSKSLTIGYIAKHDSGGNDDEGAITHALEQLGHTVHRLRESKGRAVHKLPPLDLVLFHKWDETDVMRTIRYPKVFWYFDLVDWPDPSLSSRNSTRINWMKKIMDVADLGFCTDGDWVDKKNSNRLIYLPQGADERVAGYGTPPDPGDELPPPILFTGIRAGGGRDRVSFVDEMTVNYRQAFNHVSSGVYREELRDLIARSKIVLAPKSPVSDRYWSNRVYNALGFGAFMLHPYSYGLSQQYKDGQEIIFYHSMLELHNHLKFYISADEERQRIADNAIVRTLQEHTYRHRCYYLVEACIRRFGL